MRPVGQNGNSCLKCSFLGSWLGPNYAADFPAMKMCFNEEVVSSIPCEL